MWTVWPRCVAYSHVGSPGRQRVCALTPARQHCRPFAEAAGQALAVVYGVSGRMHYLLEWVIVDEVSGGGTYLALWLFPGWSGT